MLFVALCTDEVAFRARVIALRPAFQAAGCYSWKMPPGYPSDQTIYHYFTVIGYDDANRTVLIAGPASFSGNQIYWLSFDQLATLIPPKGYAA